MLVALCLLALATPLRVKASETPYFHRYMDVKSLYIGGIPETNAQQYMSAILTAGVTTLASQLQGAVDAAGSPVNVESVDYREQVLSRYYEPTANAYYYSFQIDFTSKFNGQFHGSPIDPLVLTAVVIIAKALIAALLAAVVIVVVSGYIVQWLKDITTKTYEKITYDEYGHIIYIEKGTEPTVDVTQWVIIICVTVAAVALIPKLVSMRQKKKK